jgi:signal transduction histidine kinase
MLARIRAQARRARGKTGPVKSRIEIGELVVDATTMTATMRGKRLVLTTYEFSLLRVLAERAGRVLGREQLLQLVQGTAEDAFDRSIDVHVSRLRHKLEDDPRSPRLLKTIRGVGYMISVDLSELEALLDDVLTATRLEIVDEKTSVVAFALHLEEIAPRALAERASERFRVRHPERTLEISFEQEADAVLFRRVIDNLLENAHKYSPDSSRPIALRVTSRDARVTFEVSDQGMGIPREDLPHVFTAFFRGERSRSRGAGGVGLGLTLAKRIVEAHGGTIAVVSTPGAGTTVRAVIGTRAQKPHPTATLER